MNEGTKQAYLDKAAAQIREWRASIDVITARIAKSSADARIEYHKQFEAWTEKESTFKQKLEELKTASADGFETLKAGAQSAWSELNTSIKSLEEKTNDIRN